MASPSTGSSDAPVSASGEPAVRQFRPGTSPKARAPWSDPVQEIQVARPQAATCRTSSRPHRGGACRVPAPGWRPATPPCRPPRQPRMFRTHLHSLKRAPPPRSGPPPEARAGTLRSLLHRHSIAPSRRTSVPDVVPRPPSFHPSPPGAERLRVHARRHGHRKAQKGSCHHSCHPGPPSGRMES